jgi:DNA-binding transcriptional ArsR family regulator
VTLVTCAPRPEPSTIHKRSFMKDSFMSSDAPPRPPRRALPGSIAAGASDLSVHFEGLANPTRLLIVERLASTSEMRVSELADFCQVSQPRMSWHLRILRRAEVIRTRREGREVFCRLDRDAIATHFKSFARLISSAGMPAEITSTTPVHEGAS